MLLPWLNNFDLPTPCWLIDEKILDQNLSIFQSVKCRTNCDSLLALKAFSSHACFNQISSVLDGVTASSVYEARLGYDYFSGQIHGYMVGASDDDFRMLSCLCDHVTMNSIQQFHQFKTVTESSHISIGIRVNPMHSVVTTPKYDPCVAQSRLGVPMHQLTPDLFSLFNGLHVHALCEQTTTELFKILGVIESHFGHLLHQLDWFNWGGGHHITREDYDVDALVDAIQRWQNTYNLKVILEPGEAVVLNTGYYVTRVMDIINNDRSILVCDISATAHMPDVLEYPYRPHIINGDAPTRLPHTYRIAGNTCLAGDIIGDYSFHHPVSIGDYLVFSDMAHYTLVKTSNFNGVPCPFIGIIRADDSIELIRASNYHNFKERLS